MPTKFEDYTIGWICALEVERAIACELLDEEYTKGNEPQIDSSRDQNIYTFGRIHKHNIVIAGLPKGRYGTSSAARVAERMRSSFPAIQLSLLVGIAGGVSNQRHDIRLGDVVVSCPTGKYGGVVHYDYGIATQQLEFEVTGHLTSPPDIWLNAVGALKARYKREGHNISSIINCILRTNRRLRAEYSRPGAGLDRLYKAEYVHSDQEVCDCQVLLQAREETNPDNSSHLVQRRQRSPEEDDPAIHYGLIASADRLIKDATLRDTLAEKHDILCFEMEAAGLMNNDLRCLVIRGICDYADSHKNDIWQGYAAATAAAFAKELLETIPSCKDYNQYLLFLITNYEIVCPQLSTTRSWTLPLSETGSLSSTNTEDSADINIEVGPGTNQRSLTHPMRDNLGINLFLTGIRNAFIKDSKATRELRINICVEIAKQAEQLKTFVRVRQDDSTDVEQENEETGQDQLFLDCISRCESQKPFEATESLSRSFSGSAAFSFERSSNFVPEQYSVNHTSPDRLTCNYSKETHGATGYCIEFFLTYVVKRRRWQQVHLFVTAATKSGDLAAIPPSTIDNRQFWRWTLSQSLIQLLDSVLQDLELTGPVTKVQLPLYCNANGISQYDFDAVQTSVDYEQNNFLEEIEVDAIKHLRSIGCAQYQESQLTTIRVESPGVYLVTDGSDYYFKHEVPFPFTFRGENELKIFIDEMMRIQNLSSCRGVAKFIGVVLDDHRKYLKGYLLESMFFGQTMADWSRFNDYTIPQALRRLWARQLINSVSDIHQRGVVIGRLKVCITQRLNIGLQLFKENLRALPDKCGVRPPELRNVMDQASACTAISQKSDIFQLGTMLWKLSESLPLGNKTFCVMAGCQTRPYYQCLNMQHTNPISLPSSQGSDPILRGIIEKCRMEDPQKRSSAQDLAYSIDKEVSFVEDEIEISRQKKVFRMVMGDASTSVPIAYCDECLIPLTSYFFYCRICSYGDFDLCGSCVASGVHCWDSSHQLVKTRVDSLGNFVQ